MIKTSTFLLCAAAALALVACGDDGGSSTGSGGSTSGSGGEGPGSGTGGDGPGPGPSGSTSINSASSTAVNSAVSGTPASSSSGGDGGAGTGGTGGAGTGGDGTGGGVVFTECEEPLEIFGDPDFNACSNAFCCDQLTVCANDPGACFDVDGNLDTSLSDGADLYECVYIAGCFLGGPVCDSGIQFGNEDSTREQLEFAYCVDQSCCDEMNFCTDNGDDAQGCIDCLNGDAANFDLCQPVSDCTEANCGGGLLFVEICDSGLGSGNPGVGECLNDNCCDEFTFCTGDGSDEDIQACIDCFIAEGGALCDDAITCEETFCSTAVCESGISVGDIEDAACLTESCCEEYTDCVGDGSDDAIQECIDCFIAEGGALCDDAIDCTELNCPDE